MFTVGDIVIIKELYKYKSWYHQNPMKIERILTTTIVTVDYPKWKPDNDMIAIYFIEMLSSSRKRKIKNILIHIK